MTAPNPEKLIERGRCPVCLKGGARLSLMVTGRVSITHNGEDGGCKLQAFARDNEADERLRDLWRAAQAAPAVEAAPEVAAPAAAPAAPVRQVEEEAPAPAPAARPSWGALGLQW